MKMNIKNLVLLSRLIVSLLIILSVQALVIFIYLYLIPYLSLLILFIFIHYSFETASDKLIKNLNFSGPLFVLI